MEAFEPRGQLKKNFFFLVSLMYIKYMFSIYTKMITMKSHLLIAENLLSYLNNIC